MLPTTHSRTILIAWCCRWKKICPSANFLIKYTKKDTDKALDGDSAIELATHNYGRDEWWLLLDPVPHVPE